jgi:Zn finger protein HypA/HybF involved in hydrogenase expression
LKRYSGFDLPVQFLYVYACIHKLTELERRRLFGYDIILEETASPLVIEHYDSTGQEYRDLVVCKSCHWSASLLKDAYIFSQCPQCGGDNIEIIPVDNNEKYSLNIDKGRGIDIEFRDNRTAVKDL